MTATGSGHSQHVIAEVADKLFAAIERSDETRRRCASCSMTTSRYGEWAPAATTTNSVR